MAWRYFREVSGRVFSGFGARPGQKNALAVALKPSSHTTVPFVLSAGWAQGRGPPSRDTALPLSTGTLLVQVLGGILSLWIDTRFLRLFS